LKDLEIYHPDNNKRIQLVRDKRNFQKDGIWHIYPIAVCRKTAYFVCPYCGEIHVHGYDMDDGESFRDSHCHDNNQPYILE
jgi:predicted RNA-binding Zn-ribbon protein involved in translation (DUF1610 family)